MYFNFLLIIFLFIIGCTEKKNQTDVNVIHHDSVVVDTSSVISSGSTETLVPDTVTFSGLDRKNVPADSIIFFAQTLVGVPYLYASMDPLKGFDCSGFINYVFNRFGIKVPRSSRDFENFGETILLPEIKKGDLILFNGTDSIIKIIGHIGITISTEGEEIKFIHSTSGKAYGVTVSALNQYYRNRFMKVIRLADVQ